LGINKKKGLRIKIRRITIIEIIRLQKEINRVRRKYSIISRKCRKSEK
jgi:hypothetical protein